MPFSNEVVAGVQLVRNAIESDNYVAGTSGWMVARNGDAEFNDGTFRGTITAATFMGTDFFINPDGAFFYEGTPANGNLIFSIANQDSTDQFGNEYVAGFVAYDSAGSGPNQYIQMVQGTIFVGAVTAGVFQDSSDASSFGSSVQRAFMNAGIDTAQPTHTSKPSWNLLPGLPNATTGGANTPYAILWDFGSGNSPVDFRVTGSLVQTDLSGNPLTWQAPVPGAGWALGPNSGTVQLLEYGKNGLDRLVINGAAHTTSATPAAVLFVLPAAYRPKVTQRVVAVSNASSVLTLRYVEINSNGNVSIVPNLTASASDVYVYADVPLGNLP